MARIFVSYRRSDSAIIAGRIHDRLIAKFGVKNIFKDVDDIPPGADFRSALAGELEKCDFVLILIGQSWVTTSNNEGHPRLHDTGDWVRFEVEYALKSENITAIPVLLLDTPMPDVNQLPESLENLAYLNAVTVRNDPDFHRDIDRLINQIVHMEHEAKKASGKGTFSTGVLVIVTVGLISIVFIIGTLLNQSRNDKSLNNVHFTETIIAVTNNAIATSNAGAPLTNEAVSTSNANIQATSTAFSVNATGTANAGATSDSFANPTEFVDVQATNDAESVIVTTNALATSEANALATSNTQLEATLTQQANVPANTAPTIVFPSGRLLELTYDSAGFYLRNSSDSRVRDSRLAFIAIDSNGNGVSQPFDGVDWARFYNFIDSGGGCVAIELTDQSGWTRPGNCVSAGGAQYNGMVTFPENDTRVFWTGANGATHFVVFWDDNEIARCEISAGYCQVRIGN